MFRISIFAIVNAVFVSQSFAHVGHLGEVAGHAHWVGVAAVAGAVALGALAGKLNKKTNEDAPSEEVTEDAPEGETA